jgi:hypothetical protein
MKDKLRLEAARELTQRFHPKFGANRTPSRNTSDTVEGVANSGTSTRTDIQKYREDDYDDG